MTPNTAASPLPVRKNLLQQVEIARPCDARWDDMKGDERVRFCGQCNLNVYNVSGMMASDAEALLREKEGRVCIRLYRRSDGTILTADCPRGLEAVRRRARKMMGAAFSLVALVAGAVGFTIHRPSVHTMGAPVPMMGAIAAPAPAPTPSH